MARFVTGSRDAAWLLGAVMALQLLLGAHYVSRTALEIGDERVFVLWDDAMISMRYARNLAEGHGLVWNPGEPAVQGYTNLGVTLVMAVVHAAGAPRESAALAIQLLALTALVATGLLAARIVHDWTGDAWAATGTALAGLLCAPVQIYALQGADTSFVSLAVMAGFASLARGWLRERRWRRRAFLALGLAVIARPDATLYAALALATMLCWPGVTPGGRRGAAAPAVGLAGLWLGLVAFSQLYYGDPLPNTWYLKAVGAPRAAMWANGLDQLGFVALGLAPALALAVAALVVAPRGDSAASPATLSLERPVAALLAASGLVTAAYHVQVGGDWIRDYGSRHLVQILPIVFVLAGVGASRVAARVGSRARGPLALVLAGLCGLAASPSKPAREWFVAETPTLLHLENSMNLQRSRFLERATRSDTSIAVHWAGVGPYFADRPSLDILGRTDRHTAHLHVARGERFEPGHSKWDWDYVLDVVRPDLIDFESRGLRDHPSFRRDYLVLRVGASAHLFVRREAVAKLLDPELVVLPLEVLFPAEPAPPS